jgi:hypothetical protein
MVLPPAALHLPEVQPFASGLSRVHDFSHAAWAGHGIGVVAGELSRNAISALAEVLVTYRVPLFADSGAYGAFRSGQLAALDHGSVLARYDVILEAVHDANCSEERLQPALLVMPDAPCDQTASLRLLAANRGYVQTLLKFPGLARPIIPVHSGRRPLSRVYQDLVDVLGRDDFIVGVPSAAAALTPQAAEELFTGARPKHVHILGALSPRRLAPRLSELARSGHRPLTLSADANLLRSKIIRRGQGAAARASDIAAVLGRRQRLDELANYTEQIGGLPGLQAAYRAADPNARSRMVGLLCDLGDMTPADATATLEPLAWSDRLAA